MFLENIHIAAGQIPAETGDPVRDLREMRRFLDNLMMALERSFDQIQERMEGEKRG